MITAFHTIYIIARYVYVVLSESLSTRFQGNVIKDVQYLKQSSKYQVSGECVFEEGYGPRFFPQLYVQRYLTVKVVLEDEKWKGNIRKVVDFGCANFGFFPYLKRLTGVQEILEVDVDHDVLLQHYCRVSPLNCDYLFPRNEPLTVFVLQGSIAHTDDYLIGCDAVVGIELIEHLYPDVLEEVPYTVFGVIKPRVAVFTTPNGEFNVLFPNSEGFRHPDHKFEWTRAQFENWANNIVVRFTDYKVSLHGIGWGPSGTENVGPCSQMAVFERLSPISTTKGDFVKSNPIQDVRIIGIDEEYELLRKSEYPFHVDTRTEREKIRDQTEYSIRMLSSSDEFMEEDQILIPLTRLMPFVNSWTVSAEEIEDILKEAGWEFATHHSGYLAVVYPTCDSTIMSEDSVECEKYQEINNEIEEHIMVENWDDFQSQLSSEQKWDCDSLDLNYQIGDVSANSDWSTIKQNLLPSESEMPVKSDNTEDKNESISSSSRHISTNVSDLSKYGGDCSSSNAVNFSSDIFGKDVTPFKVSCDKTESQNLDDHHKSVNVPNCVQFVEATCDPGVLNCNTDELETINKSGEKFEKCNKESNSCSAAVNTNASSSATQSYSVPLESLQRTADNKLSESYPHTEVSLHLLKSSPNNSLYLNLQAETPCTYVETNKKQEGPTDSPAAGSVSLEEPNDRLADSGYPNSTSAQDMDLDLTPEQVDELFTENDVVADHQSDHHSDSISVSSRDSDSVSEAQQLLQPPPLVMPQPDVLFEEAMNVENGDVANNNRDGEGNNVVAVGALPNEGGGDAGDDNAVAAGIILPENLDDLIPLFAAAEDLDNDNEIEINVVEPFPPWLLNLLGLANGGNGGGAGAGAGGGGVGAAGDGVGEEVGENLHRHEISDEEDSDNNHIIDEGIGDEYNLDSSSLSDTCPSDIGLESDVGGEVAAAANP